MCSYDNRFLCIFTLTLVGISYGSPVLKSAPGIEILPAAFSDGNGPNYVIVDNENKQPSPEPVIAVRSQSPEVITTQRPIVYQPTLPQVQYQQPVEYQQPQQPQEILYQQPEQVQYQQPPPQQIQYQQPQQLQYQQPAYQPQSTAYYSPQPVQYMQPAYAYSPYYNQPIRSASPRPNAQSSSPGFFDTIARAFGLNTGSTTRPSMTSSSGLGFLGSALGLV